MISELSRSLARSFSASAISSHLPLNRSKLIDEVISDRRHGNIDAVYLGRGHVFVLVDGQRKLFTFDTKSADYIQEEDQQGCLDIETEYPVTEVIALPSNGVYIVQQNGLLQHWQYKTDYSWRFVREINICASPSCEVVDVCLNVAQNTLYWCEGRGADTPGKKIYCICKRVMNDDLFTLVPLNYNNPHLKVNIAAPDLTDNLSLFVGHSGNLNECIISNDDKQTLRRHRSSQTLIHNCPRGSVYPMGHGVLVVTSEVQRQAQPIAPPSHSYLCLRSCSRSDPPAVPVGLLLCSLTGKIDVIVGDDHIQSNLTTHTDVHFKQIVISSLNLLNKARTRPPVGCCRYFHATQSLVQVLSDGQIVHVTSEKSKTQRRVQLEDFKSEGVQDCIDVFGNLGIVYEREIRIYSLSTGRCLDVVFCPEETQIEGVCHKMLGCHMAGFYTNSDLFAIQSSRKPASRNHRELLDGCTFQSDAVRLAFIDKIKTLASITSPLSAVDQLRENWLHTTGKLPNSRLVETVEPFLREYWNLENLLQGSLNKPELIPQLKQRSARDMVDHLLNPSSHMSRSSRQVQLLLLSHSHPEDVLDGLLSYLDLGSDELSTSQYQKWQCILTAENSDVAMSCDIAVPLFEQICNLLFKQRPDKLMIFLRRGQQVCDQRVGVFIRRRQTVYERALRCIPEPNYSVDQEGAIFVTVHLLLTSETEGSVLKAVRLLLKYKKWSEAIDLLQQQTDSTSKTYMILYQIILSALNENGVLPQFSSQIFSLMPSLKSYEQFSESGTVHADEEVFCSGTSSVSIEEVRPHLLKHIVDDNS